MIAWGKVAVILALSIVLSGCVGPFKLPGKANPSTPVAPTSISASAPTTASAPTKPKPSVPPRATAPAPAPVRSWTDDELRQVVEVAMGVPIGQDEISFNTARGLGSDVYSTEKCNELGAATQSEAFEQRWLETTFEGDIGMTIFVFPTLEAVNAQTKARMVLDTECQIIGFESEDQYDEAEGGAWVATTRLRNASGSWWSTSFDDYTYSSYSLSASESNLLIVISVAISEATPPKQAEAELQATADRTSHEIRRLAGMN